MPAIGWTMKKDSLLKSTSYFSLATLISRVLGLVRDSCVAALIPAAWQDIFWLGFRIPSTFRQLFAEGALSAAFIPLLSRVREQEGEEEGKKLGSAVFYLLTLTVGTVCFVAVVLSPWFVPYLLNFPDDPEVRAAALSVASPYGDWRVEAGVKATQIMFPFLLFVALAAWAMGVLNTYRYFFIPAMASSFFNVSLIAGSFIAAAYFEGMAQMWAMGISVVIGGLLQFVVQIPPARRIGFFPQIVRKGTGKRVNLVEIDFIPGLVDKKIEADQAAAIQSGEGFLGVGADLGLNLLRHIGRIQVALHGGHAGAAGSGDLFIALEIFLFEGKQFFLAFGAFDGRDAGRMALQDRDVQLVHLFQQRFDDDLVIEHKRPGDGDHQLLLGARAGNADAGAQVARFDHQGE